SIRTKAREDRLGLPVSRKTHMTFAKAATKYLEAMEATGGKNLTRKRLHLSTQLVPILRQAAARSAHFALKRYRKHPEQAGMACSSINREVATLSHLLGFAAADEQKWIKARPHKLPPIKEGADRSIARPVTRCPLAATVADSEPDLSSSSPSA